MSSGAPREIGTAIRYPSVALLCVDSADSERMSNAGIRIDDNSPSSIYINRGRPMLFGYMTRLALTEMDICWDTPNVNSLNNELTIALYPYSDATPPVIGAPVYTRIALPVGWYDNHFMAQALETALNANAQVIANNLSFDVSFTKNGNFRFQQTSVYAPSNKTRGAFAFIGSLASQTVTGLAPLEYDLLYTLGISPSGVKATDFTGGVAPMCYTPYVDVVSNLLTKNQNVIDGVSSKKVTSSKLARIYFSNENIQNVQVYNGIPSEGQDISGAIVSNMIGTKPFLMRREFKFPKQIAWNATENVDVIDIQVLDYKGNPVFIEPITDVGDTTANNENDVFQTSNTVFRFTLQATEV